MASYKKEKNGTYTLRYRVRDVMGVEINKGIRGFKKLVDAKRHYEQIIIPTLKVPEKSASIYFKDICDEYIESKKVHLKDSSVLAAVHLCDHFLKPYFGNKNIYDITSVDIMKWQTHIDKLTYSKKKDGSGKQHYAYNYKTKLRDELYSFFEFAKLYGLSTNPVASVKGFKDDTVEKAGNFWEQAEFEQFIKVIDVPIYKLFFLTLYLTGCRKGEILGLKWSDINWDKKCINIFKTYTRKVLDKTKAKFNLTKPKTPTSVREILLPEILVSELKSFYDCRKNVIGFSNDCFIFTHDLIKPFSEHCVDYNKQKYCKLANVKYTTNHELRHSHASLLVNSGQNILVVAQRLGHKDIKMTLNTYSHLFKSNQEDLLKDLKITIE